MPIVRQDLCKSLHSDDLESFLFSRPWTSTCWGDYFFLSSMYVNNDSTKPHSDMTAEKMDINLSTDRLSFLKFLAIIKITSFYQKARSSPWSSLLIYYTSKPYFWQKSTPNNERAFIYFSSFRAILASRHFHRLRGNHCRKSSAERWFRHQCWNLSSWKGNVCRKNIGIWISPFS